MTPIKLLIMDMGNTLLNFHAGPHSDEEKDRLGLQAMQKHLSEQYQVSIPVEKLKSDFLDPWYGDFYLRQGLIELDVTNYLKPLLSDYSIELNRQAYVALMDCFYSVYKAEVVVSPAVLPLLKELKNRGIQLAVISNCILFDEIYESVFENVGLAPYIDKFVFSYSRCIRKPDHRLFLEVLEYFQVAPENCLMFGDSYTADMQPAQALGMQTLWLDNKQTTGAEQHISMTVHTIEAAAEMLKKLTLA